KGRGVVAARTFNKNEFVVEYAGELIELSTAREREGKYNHSSAVGCYMYYFKYKNKNYCIDATAETGRLGRLVNHSRLKPNCSTKVVVVENVPRLILVANKTIKNNDEILYDYGDRSKESILAHPWLAL
ncbi:hypothetical protein HELRODRAFT_82119, partial [Helobdella robusta]|uniref:SET domain-containing protein n=1 Tax=Helobdella robusta TaxID=6412 RepID=T1G4N1_HELRO